MEIFETTSSTEKKLNILCLETILMAEVFEIIKLLLISALVGGLIGIEREKKKTVLAGSRTFMLVAMYGTFAVLIARRFDNPGFISASFIGVSLVAVLLGYIKNYKLEDIGITTVVAFLIAFALGLLVGQGMIVESIAASVMVTVILVSKYYFRSFTETLTHEELVNALEFGVIAFVLYPILPDRAVDPFGVLNPRILVLLVIVVSTMGLLGFLALRRLEPRQGLRVVGALGSLVNSEAVSTSLAARAREEPALFSAAVEGIILANVVMLLRNLVIAGVLSMGILRFMAVSHLLMVVVALLYLRLHIASAPVKEPERLELALPFAIAPAVRFALLFFLISLIVRYVQFLGIGGVYLAITVGSLLSSAAVIASLVSMQSIGAIDLVTAASGCVVASIASVLAKIAVARVNGTDELARRIALPLMAIALAGELVLILQGVMA